MAFLGLQLDVPNLASTRAFYEGPLGLKPLPGATEYEARYSLGATTLRFAQGAAELRPALRLTLAIPAAQFEAAVGRLWERTPLLTVAGERIHRPPDRAGPFAYLRDVAGNLLEFAATPSEAGRMIPPLSITQIGLGVSDLAAARALLQERLGLRAGVAAAGQSRLEGLGRAAFLLAESGSSWLPGEGGIQPSPARATMAGQITACLRLPGHPYYVDMLRREELEAQR